MYLQRYPANLSVCEPELAAGNIHIVCPALNGMTNLNVFACLFGKMSLEEVHSVADRVNSTKECATLHPTISVSLLPLHRTWQESQKGPSQLFGDADVIDSNIRQCLKIHHQLIRSPVLIFALDQGNVFDRHLTISRLEHIIRKERVEYDFDLYYDRAP